MKKISIHLFTCLFLLVAFSSCRQDNPAPIRNVKAGPTLLRAQAAGGTCGNYTYYLDNTEKDLGTVYTKQVLVTFVNGLSAEEETQVLAKYDFVKGKNGQISSSSALLHNIELAAGLNCNDVQQAITLLAEDNNIAYVAPYFFNEDGLLGISNEAIVTVENGGQAALNELVAAYNAEVLSPLSGQTYLVRVDKNSQGNALELANYLKGKEGIAHAEPDFVVSQQVPGLVPPTERGRGRVAMR